MPEPKNKKLYEEVKNDIYIKNILHILLIGLLYW